MVELSLQKYSYIVRKPKVTSLDTQMEMKILVVSRNDGTVILYDFSHSNFKLASFVITKSNDHIDVKFVNIHKSVRLICYTLDKFVEIDPYKLKIVEVYEFNGTISARSMTRQNNALIFGGSSGEIQCFKKDIKFGLYQTCKAGKGEIYALAYHKCIKQNVIASSENGICSINLKLGQIEYFHNSDSKFLCLEICQKKIFAADITGNVNIFDLTLTSVNSFKTHDSAITSLSVISGNYVAVVGYDPKIVLIEYFADNDNWAVSKQIPGIDAKVNKMAQLTDGLVLGTVSGDLYYYDQLLKNICRYKPRIISDVIDYYSYYCGKYKTTIGAYNENDTLKFYELIDGKTRIIYKIHSKNNFTITAWSISTDFKYLAYSSNETRVLRLSYFRKNKELNMKSCRYFDTIDNTIAQKGDVKGTGNSLLLERASKLKFFNHLKVQYLALVYNPQFIDEEHSKLIIYKFVGEQEKPEILFELLVSDNGLINTESVSKDGKLFAFGTTTGHVYVYDVESKSLVSHITPFDDKSSAIAGMAFPPKNKRILVIYSNKKIRDVLLSNATALGWCHTFNKNLHQDWLKISFPKYVEFISGEEFYMSCGNSIIKFDITKPVPEQDQVLFVNDPKKGNRNRRKQMEDDMSYLIHKKKRKMQFQPEQEQQKTVKQIDNINKTLEMIKDQEIPVPAKSRCFSWNNVSYDISHVQFSQLDSKMMVVGFEKTLICEPSKHKNNFAMD